MFLENVELFNKFNGIKSADLPSDWVYYTIADSADYIPIIIKNRVVGYVDKITYVGPEKILGNIYVNYKYLTVANYRIKSYELRRYQGQEMFSIEIEVEKQKFWRRIKNELFKIFV